MIDELFDLGALLIRFSALMSSVSACARLIALNVFLLSIISRSTQEKMVKPQMEVEMG